jgi:multiple sugar transport system permease protein
MTATTFLPGTRTPRIPVGATKPRKPQRKRSLGRLLGIVFILLWTLIPLYWAINLSLQTNAQIGTKPSNYVPPTPTAANYARLLLGDGSIAQTIRRAALNILIECGAATIITVVLSTLAAYAFARMTFRGKNIVFYAVLATMAFPAYTTLIPLYRIMSAFGLVNTYTGIILVYVSGFLPLATWILHNYMSSLPVALEEAGLVDGANRMQVLWHVVLPIALPGIVSTALITFLFAWGQFLFPLVLSTDDSTQPLTVVISALQARHTVPTNLLSAAGVVALAVPAAIALVMNRYIVSGLLAGSVK